MNTIKLSSYIAVGNALLKRSAKTIILSMKESLSLLEKELDKKFNRKDCEIQILHRNRHGG